MNEDQESKSRADAFSSGEYRYQLRAGVLLQVHRDSDAIIRVHKPVATKIVQAEPLTSGIVVREAYYQFPRGKSNVYLLDFALRILWVAELPALTDAYANPVYPHGDFLQCASWECWTCNIDLNTGRIINKEWTK